MSVFSSKQSSRHCVICRKSAGILFCDGCQLPFCARHVRQHRQQLTDQLEEVQQTHQHLREDIQRLSNEEYHLRKINRWEKDSIKKIQIAAETARVDLRHILDKSQGRLTQIARHIAYDLNASWKSEAFSENDLVRWKKQLTDLRAAIKEAYTVNFIEDQRSSICFLSVTNQNLQHPSRQTPTSRECFSQSTKSATITNNGCIVKHIGLDSEYAHILGQRLYSQGRQSVRFQITGATLPYNIFFGCISSAIPSEVITYNSPCVVGWFGYNEIYQHGVWNNNLAIHGYESNEIQINDVLQLTFNCEQRQMELFHERINKICRLAVDLDKAPFPWQLLVVLGHVDDCVKILANR